MGGGRDYRSVKRGALNGSILRRNLSIAAFVPLRKVGRVANRQFDNLISLAIWYIVRLAKQSASQVLVNILVRTSVYAHFPKGTGDSLRKEGREKTNMSNAKTSLRKRTKMNANANCFRCRVRF